MRWGDTMSAAPEPNGGGAALIWCPFPDEPAAERTADALLSEGLIACANLLPIRSLFVWQGARDESREVAMLCKTSARLLDRAVERMAELHPYETPAVVGWRCDAAAAPTLAWLAETGDQRA